MWCSAITFRLIDLYQQNTFLWNAQHPDYKKTRLRNEAIQFIANQLGQGFTVTDVKAKIRNLRTQYLRDYCKVVRSAQAVQNNPAAVPYTPTWEYYDRLQFLEGVCTPRAFQDSENGNFDEVFDPEQQDDLVDETTGQGYEEPEYLTTSNVGSVESSDKFGEFSEAATAENSALVATSSGKKTFIVTPQQIPDQKYLNPTPVLSAGLGTSTKRKREPDFDATSGSARTSDLLGASSGSNPDQSAITFGQYVGIELNKLSPYNMHLAIMDIQKVLFQYRFSIGEQSH